MQAARGQAAEHRAHRLVALACTLLANAALVWCLLHLDRHWNGPDSAPRVRVASEALQVRWIAPRPAPPARPDPARAPARTTPAVDPLHAARRPQRATMATPSPVDGAGLAVAPPHDTPLDLSLQVPIEADNDRFRRSLLDGPAVASMAAAPVIAVRMRDASIGGLLGRMASTSRCGELRAALPSADGVRLRVILDAMQTYGCR